jgi:2-C-methyl-D-erythritol 4-phosphate cytidylyltransferase
VTSSIESSEAGRPRAAAVIVAGGSGRRFGAEVPKQYLLLAGEPVLLHTVRAFETHPSIHSVVVVLPPADADAPPRWLRETGARIVAGGEERGDSVWNGLCAAHAAEVILIHDGARPLVSHDVIDRVIAAVTPDTGAIAAIPVADTLKQVGAEHVIAATQPRAGLWQAQTPQAFPRTMILDVYRDARNNGVIGTDDASLCEHFGRRVRVVDGSAFNLKVTRPDDLHIAEALLRVQAARE